jgi:hypothetical protein
LPSRSIRPRRSATTQSTPSWSRRRPPPTTRW